MTAYWPIPAGTEGSHRTAARVTFGAICLSDSNHFPFKLHEAGGIAAWPRQTLDETGADWIRDNHEYDRHSMGSLKHIRRGRAARCYDHVRSKCCQFRRIFPQGLSIAIAPAIFELHIATLGPA